MISELRAALVSFAALTLVTGVAYPLAVTGIAHAAFPAQAQGSLIEVGGHTMGSSLLGQPFAEPRYFWGRISATSPAAYNAQASTGSNLGPTNAALFDEVKARAEALRAADPGNDAPIPIDLVTSSGSGLDPDISPEGAEYQVRRVARVRGLSEARVRSLVHDNTAERTFGVLGEPRVSFVALNMALDRERH